MNLSLGHFFLSVPYLLTEFPSHHVFPLPKIVETDQLGLCF